MFLPQLIVSASKVNRRAHLPRQVDHVPVLPENFQRFTYSKRSHFSMLPLHESQLHHNQDNCDLKVYQDMLAFNFILDNFPTGSKLLEIGGGDSRVIGWLKDRYEFWNLDKLEGMGNGVTAIGKIDGFRLVQDYIGAFSKELPNGYFDGIFSISVLEHVPKDNAAMLAIRNDIKRMLKPGGLSMHCIDAVIKKDGGWMYPLLEYIYAAFPIINPCICGREIASDQDLWGMTKMAYEHFWQGVTKVEYEKFGMPISYNVIWRNN